MPAQTATDYANMLAGSEFATAVYTAANTELFGIYSRGAGQALDVNDSRSRLLLIRADAAGVAIGDSLRIDDATWTVRAKEPGDRGVTLVLEAQ
jgi:hypothetical protein